ncbi:PspC domain-containing protein [Tepidibacter formicigenes]|jgi:phage shock protein C|uniref:Phage shock protein C (PspC) family protein n=1 Tax=Tepidibacter formicigenes DSM 15518 TaxID=1123349 RepID=A0A1M6MK24_9FIRM|nr:PspC domain-containing protein [Tepidibacter formicigenes]SHJ83818.1 phage shock protein C (PspC) family protein [Tepidibacter formicigenes DSM 15518]
MDKKIYRSRKDKVLGGVCGGIAEYFGVDPALIRILWIISFFTIGLGFLAYIVCIVIIPENPNVEFMYEKYDENEEEKFNKSKRISGIILILIGLLYLFKKYFYWIDLDQFWPFILIGIGVFLVLKKNK